MRPTDNGGVKVPFAKREPGGHSSAVTAVPTPCALNAAKILTSTMFAIGMPWPMNGVVTTAGRINSEARIRSMALDIENIEKQHGTDIARWAAKAFAKQFGKCALCDRSSRLVIDHCHITGFIRGLICTMCNSGLNSNWDHPEFRKRALLYLDQHVGLVYGRGKKPHLKYRDPIKLRHSDGGISILCDVCDDRKEFGPNPEPIVLRRGIEQYQQLHWNCRKKCPVNAHPQ